MRYYIYPIFILIGVMMGSLFPFYALSMARWSFLFLFILLLINLFPVSLKLKTILEFRKTDLYFIFFSYFFIPSLVYIVATIFQLGQSLKLGFFMTNLAPFAIITPQFMQRNDDKITALRQILTATFIFPLYFSLMLFLFFPKIVKFNILSIAQDSILLTVLPVIIIGLFTLFFNNIKIKIQDKIGSILPLLNMVIIGILSFIFVGSSYLKNDLHAFTRFDWIAIIALALFQDFGTYYLAGFFKFSETYKIVLSMKNVPFIGIFALIFFPQALFPTIMILLVHTLLVIFHSHKFKKQLLNLN